MNTFVLLQISEQVARKSAEMAARDPHGIIITIVSVSVVFLSLVILYFAYNMIGKISSGQVKIPEIRMPSFKKKAKAVPAEGVPTPEEAAAIAMALEREFSGEIYAAIGMAMHQYLNDTVHDTESYIITIKRKNR